MKKIFLGFLVFLGSLALFNSCATVTPYTNTKIQKSTNGTSVIIDKFKRTRTYTYKYFVLNSQNQASAMDSLYVIPSFVVYENGDCSSFIDFEFSGYDSFGKSLAGSMIEQVIFLSESGTERLFITPKEVEMINSHSTHTSSFSVRLSFDEYKLMRDFFIKSNNIECAVYTDSYHEEMRTPIYSKTISRDYGYGDSRVINNPNKPKHIVVFKTLETQLTRDGYWGSINSNSEGAVKLRVDKVN